MGHIQSYKNMFSEGVGITEAAKDSGYKRKTFFLFQQIIPVTQLNNLQFLDSKGEFRLCLSYCQAPRSAGNDSKTAIAYANDARLCNRSFNL